MKRRLLSWLALSASGAIAVAMLFPQREYHGFRLGRPFAFICPHGWFQSFYLLAFVLDVLIVSVPMALIFAAVHGALRRWRNVATVPRQWLRTILAVVSFAVLVYLISLVCWHPRDLQRYEATDQAFTVGDASFKMELYGTARCSRWPLGHARLWVGSPYHIGLFANVNSADYQLTVNALSITSTTIDDLSLVPSHWSGKMTLHTGHDYASSPSFRNTYWSYSPPRTDIPLDYTLDTEAVVTIDASLRHGNGDSRTTNTIVFVQSQENRFRSSWFFCWGM